MSSHSFDNQNNEYFPLFSKVMFLRLWKVVLICFLIFAPPVYSVFPPDGPLRITQSPDIVSATGLISNGLPTRTSRPSLRSIFPTLSYSEHHSPSTTSTLRPNPIVSAFRFLNATANYSHVAKQTLSTSRSSISDSQSTTSTNTASPNPVSSRTKGSTRTESKASESKTTPKLSTFTSFRTITSSTVTRVTKGQHHQASNTIPMTAENQSENVSSKITIDALAALCGVLGVLLLCSFVWCYKRHLKYRKHSPIIDEEVDPWDPEDGSMPHAAHDWPLPHNVAEMPAVSFSKSNDDPETIPFRALANRTAKQKAQAKEPHHWRHNWNNSVTSIESHNSSSSASSDADDPVTSVVDLYQQPLRRKSPQRTLNTTFMQEIDQHKSGDKHQIRRKPVPAGGKSHREPGQSRWVPPSKWESPRKQRRRSGAWPASHNNSRTRLSTIAETEGFDLGSSDPEWTQEKRRRLGETGQASSDIDEKPVHPALRSRRDLGEFSRSGPR